MCKELYINKCIQMKDTHDVIVTIIQNECSDSNLNPEQI